MNPLIDGILVGQIMSLRASADVFDAQAESAQAVVADALEQKSAALARADELEAALADLRSLFPVTEPEPGADSGDEGAPDAPAAHGEG
jgi:hypothetical protein